MENLNFDWPLGFGMKSLGGGDHCLRSISQIACFGDMSDEIPAFANLAIGDINQMSPGATLCPTLPVLPYWGMMIMRL
jgi:hypothetical protein